MEHTSWQQQYWNTVPKIVDTTKYSSISEFLETVFKKYHKLIMCENMGKEITYKKVDELSQAFAAYLQNYTELKAGSHVAIQLPNVLQYVVALLGLLRAGMVVVNINPMYTTHEMLYQLTDANVEAIIILENFAHKVTQILPKTAIKTVIVSKVGDLLGSFYGRIVNFTVKYIKRLIPSYHYVEALNFKKILQEGCKVPFQKTELQRDNIAFLQYTGGTTGIPKGAVLTHGNILANIAQADPLLRLRLTEVKQEVVIIPLPLYHIYALVGLLNMFGLGSKNILITNPRDINFLIKKLKKNFFTCIIGINTLFERLLSHKKFATLNFSHLKFTGSGGIKTQPQICQQWKEVTGNTITEGYGLTESSPGIASNTLDGILHLPFPSTKVKVIDDHGHEVPCGTRGELLVKGPQIMKEYWKKPLETVQAFLDGWFKTGDIAIMNENGLIEIVDRKKDMINISGFNVYPNEIENVVSGHPKVLEVGAVGILDMSLKEAVQIFVVKKDGTLTTEDLIAYCKERLVRYKIPKYVEFKKSLPKSNVGKVLRRLLKDWKDGE